MSAAAIRCVNNFMIRVESMKRHIAYWQSGAWCDDKQLPELASTDYDVLVVDADALDVEVEIAVMNRIAYNTIRTFPTCTPLR